MNSVSIVGANTLCFLCGCRAYSQQNLLLIKQSIYDGVARVRWLEHESSGVGDYPHFVEVVEPGRSVAE